MGAKDAPAAPEPSSLGSTIEAVGDAESAGVGVDALTDVDAVALAVTSGVDVALAEGSGDAVELDAQPAARRTTTTMAAQARRPRPSRQRLRRLADALSCPEPAIGSTPRRDLLPIGIWPPFPHPVVMRRRPRVTALFCAARGAVRTNRASWDHPHDPTGLTGSPLRAVGSLKQPWALRLVDGGFFGRIGRPKGERRARGRRAARR